MLHNNLRSNFSSFELNAKHDPGSSILHVPFLISNPSIMIYDVRIGGYVFGKPSMARPTTSKNVQSKPCVNMLRNALTPNPLYIRVTPDSSDLRC